MRSFRRRLLPLLPPEVRAKLRIASVGAVVLATLDALGVALVLPLIQLVTTLEDRGPMPSPAGRIAEAIGTTDRQSTALALALAVFAAFTAKSGAALVLLRFGTTTCLRAEANMADRLTRAYLHAPFRFHLDRNSAELQTTLQESLRRVYQDGLMTSIPALADRLVMVAVGSSLILIAPLEAFVGAICLAVIAGAYRRVATKRSLASSTDIMHHIRRSYQLTQQALMSIREIRVTGTESHFADALLDVRQAHIQRQTVLTLTEQLPRYYLELGIVASAASVAAISFAVRAPTQALAILGVFLAGGLRLLPALNRVLNAASKAHAALPHLDKVESDLAQTQAIDSASYPTTPLPEHLSTIKLSDVHFEYDPGNPVLRGVDVEIEAGEWVAFVGTSGAGKTTIVSILLGLLDPTDGEVAIDSVDLPRCRVEWQRRLGYVPQDVVILDASIRENVAFGEATPEDARVWQSLKSADLAHLVSSFPDGLDTVVGEGGSRLSGGQRQRLGLARCLYRRPEVLVLDESTSALDNETEARVLDALGDALSEATVILVAHRLTTVERCDKIVVLDDGRVEAMGGFGFLLTESHTFAQLAADESRAAETMPDA